MTTKQFTFPLRNYMFDMITFESILIKDRISEYELMCSIQQIYREANYFKHISLIFSVQLMGIVISILLFALCLAGYIIGLV